MATKISSLRRKEIIRFGYCEISEYIWCSGKTHKILKKPKKVIKINLDSMKKLNKYGMPIKDISRKHKINQIKNDRLLSSAYIHKQLKGLIDYGCENLIEAIFSYNSPVNSKSIAIRYVLQKFYERRDLISSLSIREFKKTELNIIKL